MNNRRLVGSLLTGPIAWTIHLFVVYVIIALWCTAGWTGQRIAVLFATLVLGALSLAGGVVAFRQWKQGQEEVQRDIEPGTHETWDSRLGERGARGLFIAVLAMFMAGLFGFLIITQGLSPLLAPECNTGFSR